MIGEEDAVRLGFAQLVRKAPPDALVIVGIGIGDRGHFNELGTAEAQRIFLLPSLGFRDHDQSTIAARIGDEG